MGDLEGATSTDADLIAASITDPERFTIIFERHSLSVFKFLSSDFGHTVANDLLGETFATAFRIRDRYDVTIQTQSHGCLESHLMSVGIIGVLCREFED